MCNVCSESGPLARREALDSIVPNSAHLKRSCELVRGLRRRSERFLQQLFLLLQHLDARGRGRAARGGAGWSSTSSARRGGASDDDGRLRFGVVHGDAAARAGQRVPHFLVNESPLLARPLENGDLVARRERKRKRASELQRRPLGEEEKKKKKRKKVFSDGRERGKEKKRTKKENLEREAFSSSLPVLLPLKNLRLSSLFSFPNFSLTMASALASKATAGAFTARRQVREVD